VHGFLAVVPLLTEPLHGRRRSRDLHRSARPPLAGHREHSVWTRAAARAPGPQGGHGARTSAASWPPSGGVPERRPACSIPLSGAMGCSARGTSLRRWPSVRVW